MFGQQLTFLILVLVIALAIFGPPYLPALGRALGRSLQEFRRATRAKAAGDHRAWTPLASTRRQGTTKHDGTGG